MGCSSSKEENSNSPVDLSHFSICRAIGKGAFGKVSIVELRKDKKLFALKYIPKDKCIAEKAVQHVLQERNLLEEVKHPFICNLRYSFQDDETMYMVLDLMLGGDLRFHMKNDWKENDARIVVAEICSALEYLHSNQIVHRDIKPDNVLLDQSGHAVLTDFNIAVKFTDGHPLKSIAGTEPYMAPELLNGKGYYSSVDWWSMGVLMYELLYGQRPFRTKHKRELILRGEYRFPDTPVTSEDAKSVIRGMLTLDINQRLGHGKEGIEKLRSHRWFGSISWDRLNKREVAPGFVPDAKRANFDASYDLEEMFLEERPLKASKRKLDVTKLDGDMLVIENEFRYYDYTKPQGNPRPLSAIQNVDLDLINSSISLNSAADSCSLDGGSSGLASKPYTPSGSVRGAGPAHKQMPSDDGHPSSNGTPRRPMTDISKECQADTASARA